MGKPLVPVFMQHCFKGNVADVKSTLKKYPDYANVTDGGSKPIHVASQAGHDRVIQLLINSGADVNALNPGGKTAAHLIALNGRVNCLSELLKAKPDLNIRDQNGCTPIFYAAKNGKLGVATLLLETGVDITIPGEGGKLPIDVAEDPKIKSILEKVNSNPTKPLPKQASYKERKELADAITLKNVKKIEEIMTQFPEIKEEIIYNGFTPLTWSVQCGDPVITAIICRHRPYLDQIDQNEVSALHIAAAQGKIDIGKCLLNFGADIGNVSHDKLTPIETAAKFYQHEFCKMLMSRGSDPEKAAEKYPAAKESCKPNFFINMMKAVDDGKLSGVKQALKNNQGAASARNPLGQSALQKAARKNNVEILSELIKAGADVNASDDHGWTALHEAADCGSIEALRVLLENNAKVNKQDRRGRTPLHWGAMHGHPEVCTALLGANAKKNAKDENGKTAFDVAKDEATKAALS